MADIPVAPLESPVLQLPIGRSRKATSNERNVDFMVELASLWGPGRQETPVEEEESSSREDPSAPLSSTDDETERPSPALSVAPPSRFAMPPLYITGMDKDCPGPANQATSPLPLPMRMTPPATAGSRTAAARPHVGPHSPGAAIVAAQGSLPAVVNPESGSSDALKAATNRMAFSLPPSPVQETPPSPVTAPGTGAGDPTESKAGTGAEDASPGRAPPAPQADPAAPVRVMSGPAEVPVILAPAAQILREIETARSPVLLTPGSAQDKIPPTPEIRVLRVRLRPEELGDVELTLRRSGTGLKVHIAVEKPSAAEWLQRDLTVLNDRIGELLAVSSEQPVTIVVQSMETTGAQPSATEQRAAGDRGTAGFGTQSDDGSRRPRPGRDDDRSSARGHARDDETDRRRGDHTGRIV